MEKKLLRENVYTKYLNVAIDATLYNRWDHFCKNQTLGNKQQLTAAALKEFMAAHLIKSKIS